MFQFANPGFLLLLLAVPPLVWWWLRWRRPALRYPDTVWLAVLPGGRSLIASYGGAVLRATALVLLVFALAGPRWPDRGTRIPTEGIAIQMVVDVSPSMGELDYQWHGKNKSRLETAKDAFRLFVRGGEGQEDGPRFEGRPNDLIGLLTFGDRPETACPLTLSHSVLLDMVGKVESKTVSETNISDALVLGLYRLKNAPPKRKVLVLLSDGEHNYLNPRSEWKPLQAAQIAANLGIPIYTIDAGGDVPGADDPDTSDGAAQVRAAGIRTLQDIARLTNGKYFQARDGDALLAACRDLDEQLEREQIESFQYRRYFEGFPWFALASLVLLVTATVFDRTVWLRIP
jgi:Ca-activated chloride channel family protein